MSKKRKYSKRRNNKNSTKSQNIMKFLENKYENMKEVHDNYQKYVFKFRLKQ
jgi:hypothetical protein